jgi:hypothetical protein
MMVCRALLPLLILGSVLGAAEDPRSPWLGHAAAVRHAFETGGLRWYALPGDGGGSSGWQGWQQHLTTPSGKAVVLAGNDTTYRRLWRIVPVDLPAGTRVRATWQAALPSPGAARLELSFLGDGPGTEALPGATTWVPLATSPAIVEAIAPAGTRRVNFAAILSGSGRVEITGAALAAELSPATAAALGCDRALADIGPEPPAFTAVPGAVIAIPIGSGGRAQLDRAPAQPIDRPTGSLPPPIEPSDGIGSFRLAADDEHLWVRLQMVDQTLVTDVNHDSNDDSFELYLSPLLHGEATYRDGDVQLLIRPDSPACTSVSFGGNRFDPERLPVQAWPSKTADGWAVDLAIPLRNGLFRLRPWPGQAIGVSASYNDNDRRGQRDHKTTWTAFDPQERAWTNPSLFGIGVFVGGSQTRMPPRPPPPPPPSDWDMVPTVAVAADARPGNLDLMENGGFLHGDRGWGRWYGDRGLRFSVVDEGADGKALLVDGREALASSRLLLCAQPFDVLPGERYLATVRMRADRPLTVELRTKTPLYIIKHFGNIAVPADAWVEAPVEMLIPNDHRGNNDIAQVHLVCSGIAGARLWVDSLRLVRRVPGRVDAAIQLDDRLHATTIGAPLRGRLVARAIAGTSTDPVTVRLAVRSWPDAAVVAESEHRLAFAADGEAELPLELPTDRPGCFRIDATVDDGSGALLPRRTAYVVLPPTRRGSGLADLCHGHCIYLPDGAALMAEATERLGAASVRIMVGSLHELVPTPGRPDVAPVADLADALAARGISFQGEVSTCWGPANARIVVGDPAAWSERLAEAVRALRGRIQVWEIGNEPNLRGGWSPTPDAAAYEAVLRAAWCAVRSSDPEAQVSTAGINRARVPGFVADFLEAGQLAFCDLLSFHYYETVSGATWQDDAATLAAAVDRFRPGLRLVDGESGNDGDPLPVLVEKLTKRLPVLAWSGVAAHNEFALDRMCNGWLLADRAAPTPGAPALATQNWLLGQATCTGRGHPAPGWTAYAFTRPEGPCWVLWREPGVAGEPLDLGEAAGTRIHDVVGAEVTDRFRRDGRLLLDNLGRMPVYVLDPPQFAIAWEAPPTRPPAAPIPWERQVVLLPERHDGVSRLRLPGDGVVTWPLVIRNLDGQPRTVRLTVAADAARVDAHCDPSELVIPAGGTARTAVRIAARTQLSDEPLRITGEAGGQPLVPLTTTLRSETVAVQSDGRRLRLRNPGPGTLDATWSASSTALRLGGTVSGHVTLAMGQEMVLPCSVTGWIGAPGPADLIVTLTRDGNPPEHLSTRPAVWIAAPADAAASAPLLILPDLTKPKVKASFTWGAGRLGAAIVVEDPQHRQGGDSGFIDQGDCLILGLDQRADSLDPAFGADDLEVGVARRDDGRIVVYRWDGRFGPEAAKPWPEATATVERTGTTTRYTVSIPLPLVPEGAAAIGLNLRVVDAVGNAPPTSIGFGANDDGRDPSRWGTLLLPGQ